ncbi:DUF4145 domain-containing protein [Sulfurimonas sp.]
MYTDFTKFDYEKLNVANYEELEKRDKEYYKNILLNWFQSNLNDIVDRRWNIDDIGAIQETSDFIKLIKESEFSYSIAGYTSAIALIGIASEDLCRYFSNLANHNFDNLSQFDRVNKLYELNLFNEEIKNNFHQIRKIRNDCLHYNENFKSKDKNILEEDALTVINILKSIYSSLFLNNISDADTSFSYNEIIEQLSKEVAYQSNLGDTLSQDEITLKLRNAFASFTGIDLSISKSEKYIERISIFIIKEIDLQIEPNEMTLFDTIQNNTLIIDLTSEDIEKINNKNITENMHIISTVYSNTNELGMTAEWKFKQWNVI